MVWREARLGRWRFRVGLGIHRLPDAMQRGDPTPSQLRQLDRRPFAPPRGRNL